MIHDPMNNLTLDNIRAVPLLKPANAGGYWEGVSHGELIDTLLQCLHERGYQPAMPVYVLSPDKADLAATFHVLPKTRVIPPFVTPPDTTLGIGVQTSNARRRALSICCGLTIGSGGNFVSGDIPINRKHTTGFDLYDGIMEALDNFFLAAANLNRTVEGYKSHKLTLDQAGLILIKAGQIGPRNARLSYERIGRVINLVYGNYGKGGLKGGLTSWRLLQLFSYVVETVPPLRQMDILNKFRELVPLPKKFAMIPVKKGD